MFCKAYEGVHVVFGLGLISLSGFERFMACTCVQLDCPILRTEVVWFRGNRFRVFVIWDPWAEQQIAFQRLVQGLFGRFG